MPNPDSSETRIPESGSAPAPGGRRTAPPGRRLLRRAGIGLLAACVLLGLVWLALQLALSSPTLPHLISRRSERLHVEWSSAFMPIPGRLTLSNLRIRGRSRRIDWAVELDRVSLRVDLRELFERRFSASRIRGEGVRFHLRRRFASPEDRELLPFLPPIPGFAPAGVGERRPRAPPPGWRIDLADLDLRSFEEIWIDDLRLRGEGRVAGDVRVQVRGPFAVPGLDLAWTGGELASRGAKIGHRLELTSRFALEPVATRGLRVRELLRALAVEIELDGEVLRLSFLDPYLRNAAGLRLDGEGEIHVVGGVAGGVLTPASRLEVEARRLEARLPRVSLLGSGTLSLESATLPEDRELGGTELRAALRDVEVEGLPGVRGTSREITLTVRTAGADLLGGFSDPEVTLDLPALELSDLGVFAELLPERVPVRPLGGSARVSTRLDLQRTDGEARILVSSRDLALELGDERELVEAELDVRYRGGLLPESFSIAGTELHFATRSSTPATADLVVREGAIVLAGAAGGRRDPASALRLGEGELHLEGRLSDLAALDEHFGYGRWLHLAGPVVFEAQLDSRGGRLEPGSRIDMGADELVASFFDWSVSGRARVRSRVLPGGATELGVDFDEAEIARHGYPHMRAPSFRLEASGPDLSGGPAFDALTLRLDLPGAQVFDVAPFNDYLPAKLVRLVSGEAILDGSANLAADDGRAELTLDGRSLTLELLGETVRTNLRLETRLSSRAPASRRFTFERSTLTLDDSQWLGAEGETTEPWSGELELVGGSVEVGRPLSLDADLRLRLQDTRPLYHLLARQLPAVEWFERWLVFDGVVGAGRVELAPGRLTLRELDVHGRGARLAGGLSLETAEDDGEKMLERFSQVALDAEIEQPMLLDLRSLNRHLPESGVIRFGAGEGRLSGRLHLEETSGSGAVQLVGTGLETHLRDERLDTDLRFDFDLSSDDLASRRFRLDGTRVELANTRWLGDGRAPRNAGWWGELEIVDGDVELGTRLAAVGRLRLRLRDNRPLVYLLAERSRVVRWFQGLLEIDDIEGTARVTLDRRTLRVDALRIEGEHLLIEALLDYTGGTEYGLFYVWFRGLDATVELLDGRRSFRILKPRQWFERRRAEHSSRSGVKRPSAGRSSIGRPSAGRPSAGRPSAGRPSAGRR